MYGDRTIFLLLCAHEITESEYWKMEINTSQKIFTQENRPKSLWDQFVHNIQQKMKVVVIINVDWDRAILLLFCAHQIWVVIDGN